MQHVALMGKARSGKDTVAQILVRHAQYTRLAFADRLKEAALRVDPYVYAEAAPGHVTQFRLSGVVEKFGWERAKTFPEVRRFLQEYGQTVREMDQEFWVKPVVDQMMSGFHLNMPCVVSDVRYRNEVTAMRRAGALIVRVERPGAGLTGDAGTHASETELDDVEPDVTLYNGGDLDDLRGYVQNLYATHLAPSVTNGE